MTPHSSILAWEIPWTEEPDGLQSMGSQRVRHDRIIHNDSFSETPAYLGSVLDKKKKKKKKKTNK